MPAPDNNNWSNLHDHWADLAVQFGDQPAPEVLRDRIAPFADVVTTTLIMASPVMGHYVAKLEHLLGRYDEADAFFRRAMTIHGRLESPR